MNDWLQSIAQRLEAKLQEKVCTNMIEIDPKVMDPRNRVHSAPVRLLAEAARRRHRTDIGTWQGMLPLSDLHASSNGISPLLAGIMNNGGVRSGLKKGELTLGDVEQFYPFDNGLSTCEMAEWFLGALLRFNAEVLSTPDAHFG